MERTTTERFDLERLLPPDRRCAACAQRACSALSDTPGIADARCDLDEGIVSVSYDRESLTSRQVREMLVRHAYDAAESVGHAVWRLEGLD